MKNHDIFDEKMTVFGESFLGITGLIRRLNEVYSKKTPFVLGKYLFFPIFLL